ncbi:hypothetical protein [Streptomyces sp. NPDC058268]|uniref:hypothetical protein n=1 Tax=Streptomyces sp. NPDC058268 TaxID=3346413 RepID=UPI0036EBC525
MPVHPLADQAATLRSKTLTLLRAPVGREFWGHFMRDGHSFVMPAAWSTLPRSRQIENLLAAEDRRIAGGTTFAMTSPLAQAARAVGQDQSIALPFTPDVLPAPSGLLIAEEPLLHVGSDPLVAVTWGPPMDGFIPGVHLTWWTAMRDQDQEPDAAARGRFIPMVPDFDLHLPFVPFFDTRLNQRNQELDSGLIYSAVPLRTIVAAWYALTADSTTLSEERPQASITQALKEQKAKSRGVRVATVPGLDAALSAITERAAHKMSDIQQTGTVFDPPPEVAATPQTVSYGVFGPVLDHQLDAGQQRIAHVYREAAEHWHRLEMQVTQRYPGVFEALEELRVREHGQWRPWCWVPSMRVTTWLMEMYKTPVDKAMWDAPRIAALGAWRSGGRHSILTTLLLQDTASDRTPVELTETMPAPGLGMVIDDNGTVHLLLVCLDDVADQCPSGAELLLITNEGQPTRMLDGITKLTVFLTGDTLLDAVKITQARYDEAAVKNGEQPQPADEAMYAEHAYAVGLFTGLLSAICRPGAALTDAGALTGRKFPAAWPPEPGLLAETTLWLLTGTPTAR